MKISYTILLVIMCGFIVRAQDSISFKPVAKSVTAEVNFAPFSPTPINITYLRFRTFTSEHKAVRIGISAGSNNQKPNKNTKLSSYTLDFRIGGEWHYQGTERLSPYIGLEADVALKNTSVNLENNSIKKIDGAWDSNGTERGFVRGGASFLIGADYYLAKHLYLGTEIGVGFQVLKESDIKTTLATGTVPDVKGGSIFQFGPNFNSSIRLGYILK